MGEHNTQEQHEVWRTFKEVISCRVLVVRCLILFFIWATDAFVFYGLSLNSTSLSGNKYVNFILVCLVEIPGYTMSWFTMNWIGRRWSLAGSLLLCAFTCALGGFISHGKHKTVFSHIIYKFTRFKQTANAALTVYYVNIVWQIVLGQLFHYFCLENWV